MEGVGGSSEEDLGEVPTLTHPGTKPTTQPVLTRFAIVVTPGAPHPPPAPAGPPYLAQPLASQTVRPGGQVTSILIPETTGQKVTSLHRGQHPYVRNEMQPPSLASIPIWGEAHGRVAEAQGGHASGVLGLGDEWG